MKKRFSDSDLSHCIEGYLDCIMQFTPDPIFISSPLNSSGNKVLISSIINSAPIGKKYNLC